MKIYSKKIKDQAFALRKKKKSYKEIFDVLKIPKSTLSSWFGKKWEYYTTIKIGSNIWQTYDP